MMPRKTGIYLQFLAYCWLVDFSLAIIGLNVRTTAFKDFSFIVSIAERPQHHQFFENLHFCTGSLISKKSVLTAAHCLLNRHISEVEVIAGSTNVARGTRYFPESWITYIEWSTGQKQQNHSLHDVALIILQGEGVQSLNVTPATIETFETAHLDKKKVKFAGWGKTETGHIPLALRAAGLYIVSNEECSAEGTKLKGTSFSVPPNYFCSVATPWVLSSPGDGGAPVCDRRKQVMGINIGVCPNLEGLLYTTEFLNQHQLNSHLNLHYYRHFLASAMK